MKNELSAKYRRRGQTGVLTLEGHLGIAEAESLKALAVKALEDKQAASVKIDMADAALDTAAWQILMALCRDVNGEGRRCEIAAPAGDFAGRAAAAAEWPATAAEPA